MNARNFRYYTYVKPYFKNKTVRTYTSFIFTLFMVSFFALYAIRPTINTITSLRESIQQQQDIAISLQKKVSDLSVGKANFENIKPTAKETLNNLVPNSPELPKLIDSLAALAYQEQATLSGIQFSPVELEPISQNPTKSATVKEIQLSFSMQGSYDRLIKTLNGLKQLNRLISIESVNMNRQEEGTIIMTVNAKTLYVK